MKLQNIASVLFCISACAFSSCSDNDIANQENYVDEIQVTLMPFDYEVGTRAQMTVSGGRTYFKFYSSDVLGFFSCLDNKQYSYQMAFPINDPSGEGVSSFSFDGGGWRMLDTYNYTAYLPFDYENKDAEKIPVSFVGQKQIGNNSSTSLNPFMTCDQTKPVNNSLKMSMNFRSALLWIQVKVPEATTIKRAALYSEEDVFIVKSHFNLMSSPQAWDHSKDEFSKTLSLGIEGLTTTTANSQIDLYMTACPTDKLVGKTLKLVLVNDSDETYVGSFTMSRALTIAGGAMITPSLTKTETPLIVPQEGLEGVTGSAGDFELVPVGGTTRQAD